MDTLDLVTLAVALTSLLGPSLIAIINNITHWNELKLESSQKTQTERISLLRDIQLKIINLLAEHEKEVQYSLWNSSISNSGGDRKEGALRAATSNAYTRLLIGYTLSIPDKTLTQISTVIQEAHQAKNGDKVYEAGNQAISRLGDMINDEMQLVPKSKSAWKFWQRN